MKRLLSFVLCSVLVLLSLSPICSASSGQLVETDEPVAEPISVSAYAATVIDMKTGRTLFEYDADEQNYPASTTKVMTAYLCLKYGDPDDIITVSEDAFSDISAMASTGGLVVGETMTVRRLLKALLVVSASEAANVVGEYISGSHEEFVNLMNEEAQALGCTGTHFANCHGLPNSEHYTTAHDMALIAQAAMQYEVFREIVGSAITTMEATNKSSATTLQSTNGILPGSSYTEYNYPYAIGIKTGHTSAAGFCLISAAVKDDMELLCVIMGCPSRVSSFAQTISLYDWAFENYDSLTYGWVQTEDLSEEIDADADAPDTEGITTAAVAVDEDSAQESSPETSSGDDLIATSTVSEADDSIEQASAIESDDLISDYGSEAETTAMHSLRSQISLNLSPQVLLISSLFLLAAILLIILLIIVIHKR